MPRASPPHAIMDWIAATERALPWPLAAGISARRHHSSAVIAPVIGGLLNVRTPSSGSPASRTSTGGGGISGATRGSASGGRPMWKSAPSGSATVSLKNAPSETPVIRRTTSPTR